MDTVILKDRITGSFSDEEFFQFCMDNRDLDVERNNKLQIIVHHPMDSFVLKGGFTQSFSDEEFYKFCLDNPDLRIERDSNLQIVIMSPVGSEFSFYSGAVHAQLFNWSMSTGRGIPFDSSGGFTLSDRSVLSPDASWVSDENWNKLSAKQRSKFASICPEFIIEVRSESDRLYDLQKKMDKWISNGAQLAWLVDPIGKTVFIYRKQGEFEIIKDFSQHIKGEGPVEGFTLDLSMLSKFEKRD